MRVQFSISAESWLFFTISEYFCRVVPVAVPVKIEKNKKKGKIGCLCSLCSLCKLIYLRTRLKQWDLSRDSFHSSNTITSTVLLSHKIFYLVFCLVLKKEKEYLFPSVWKEILYSIQFLHVCRIMCIFFCLEVFYKCVSIRSLPIYHAIIVVSPFVSFREKGNFTV